MSDEILDSAAEVQPDSSADKTISRRCGRRLVKLIERDYGTAHGMRGKPAQDLKIDATQWSRYIQGKTTPDYPILLRVAKHFGCTADDLIGEDEPDLSVRRNDRTLGSGGVRGGIHYEVDYELIERLRDYSPDSIEKLFPSGLWPSAEDVKTATQEGRRRQKRRP